MHLTEISVTLKLPVHECDMNLDFVEQKWTLESVACQVNYLIHVSQMQSKQQLEFLTFADPS